MRERNAELVLIDERVGTDVARRAGVQAVGTLGVLIEAGLQEWVDFDAALTRLANDTSFYASSGPIKSTRLIFQQRQQI